MAIYGDSKHNDLAIESISLPKVDFRIYIYKNGSLKKLNSRYNKLRISDTLEEAKQNIKVLQNRYFAYHKKPCTEQFVICKYIDKYESQIVYFTNDKM